VFSEFITDGMAAAAGREVKLEVTKKVIPLSPVKSTL
jgi:hypothetical protein